MLPKSLNGENQLIVNTLKDHIDHKVDDLREDYREDHDTLTRLDTSMKGLDKRFGKLEDRFNQTNLVAAVVAAIVAIPTTIITVIFGLKNN